MASPYRRLVLHPPRQNPRSSLEADRERRNPPPTLGGCRRGPRRLAITPTPRGAECCAACSVHQPGPSAPADPVAWPRPVLSCRLAAEARELTVTRREGGWCGKPSAAPPGELIEQTDFGGCQGKFDS